MTKPKGHPPAFQFYVDDFIADSAVDAMSNEEVGIYVRFLCKAWKERPVGTIPDDDRILANWAKTTPAGWKKCRAGVLRAFILEGGRYHQKRMKTEWQKILDYREGKTKAGHKGADERWHNHVSAIENNGKNDGRPIAEGMADPMPKNGSSLSLSSSSSSESSKSDSSSCESPKKFKPRGDYFDLTGLDWPEVLSRAEAVAKRIRPRSLDDRRAWLTFAVLSVTSFSEDWLLDAAEAVVNAAETKETRPAHFIGVLKSKANDAGTKPADFNELFKRVRIPDGVWKSSVLGGPTP